MSGRADKLIKRFCDYWHKDYSVYLRRYKALDKKNKTEVREAIKKSLPVIN
jgi:hypothetical protein